MVPVANTGSWWRSVVTLSFEEMVVWGRNHKVRFLCAEPVQMYRLTLPVLWFPRRREKEINREMLLHLLGPVSKKIWSPLVILSMEKTMVTKVISELKSVSRLKILPETGPRCQILGRLCRIVDVKVEFTRMALYDLYCARHVHVRSLKFSRTINSRGITVSCFRTEISRTITL